MLIKIGASDESSDIVDLLLACHQRIRFFIDLAIRLAETTDASNDESARPRGVSYVIFRNRCRYTLRMKKRVSFRDSRGENRYSTERSKRCVASMSFISLNWNGFWRFAGICRTRRNNWGNATRSGFLCH